MIILNNPDDDTELVISMESLIQAGIIFVMAIMIVITNVLIIATFVNFRGKYHPSVVIPYCYTKLFSFSKACTNKSCFIRGQSVCQIRTGFLGQITIRVDKADFPKTWTVPKSGITALCTRSFIKEFCADTA